MTLKYTRMRMKNKMNTDRARRGQYKITFAVVLVVVLLTSCVFVGSVLAWLQERETPSSIGNISIGEVEFEIYNGDTKITTDKKNKDGIISAAANPLAIDVSGSSNIIDLSSLKIRNIGTIPAIMRVQISIYYVHNNNNVALLLSDNVNLIGNQIEIDNSTWVNDFAGASETFLGSTSGYSYYNSKINPYIIRTLDENDEIVESDPIEANAVSVINKIRLPDLAIRPATTYYISLSVEGVSYSGNIYKEESEGINGDIPAEGVRVYPFGIPEGLPEEWTAWQ